MAFETMLGSADKAKNLLSEIVETAKQTPFQLDELVVSSKQLLAYGFAQEDVIKTTTMLGDISAGLNLNLADMAWLYGTTRVQGRLFSKDLYQFTNRGIPLTAELAKQFGVTEGEVQKLVEQGKVGFPEVEKALQSMTGQGGQFNDLMIKQSATLGGLISNLKDSFSILGMEIVGVSATGEIIKGGLFDKVKEAAVTLYTWIEQNKESIRTFALETMQNEVIPAIMNVIQWIKEMVQWFKNNEETIRIIIEVVKMFGTVIAFVFKAIALAVVTLSKQFEQFFYLIFLWIEGFKENWGGALSNIKSMFSSFASSVVGVAKKMFEPIKTAFFDMVDAIVAVWNKTIGGKGFKAPDWVPKFGGKEFTIPKLPSRAVGGSMTSGKAYMVGENGPEMFIPSSNGRIEKNPQSASINIVFNNPVVRSDADIDKIIRLVKQSIGRDNELNRINAF